MSKTAYTNEEIKRAAHNVRKRVLGLCIDRGGCYLTQACSSAEILNTLYMRILNLGPSLGNPDAQRFPGVPGPENMNYPKGSLYNGFDYANPDYTRDRLFFSCCHYAVVLYCSLVECGRLGEKAIEKFNVDGWNMEMIGAEHSPGFENTAGSLGQTVSIAVYGEGDNYCYPCGACRQFLAEFAPDMEVLSAKKDRYVSNKLSELLPHTFNF